MNGNDSPKSQTPLERRITEALWPDAESAERNNAEGRLAGVAAWTPECPEPDELMKLAGQGRRAHNSPVMRHVVGCDHCRPHYAALRAELTATAPESATEPGTWRRRISALLLPRVLVPALGVTAAALAYVVAVPLRQAQQTAETALDAARREIPSNSTAIQTATQTARALSAARRSAPAAPPGESLRDTIAGLQVAQVTPDAIERLRLNATVVRGAVGAAGMKLIEPVATYVASLRPLLRWEPVPGATRYALSLGRSNADPSADITQTLNGEGATVWRPDKPLLPGITYEWEVTALDAAGKSLTHSRARFGTRAQGKPLPPLGRTLMDLAQRYEKAGLLTEARRLYAAVGADEAEYDTAQARLHALTPP